MRWRKLAALLAADAACTAGLWFAYVRAQGSTLWDVALVLPALRLVALLGLRCRRARGGELAATTCGLYAFARVGMTTLPADLVLLCPALFFPVLEVCAVSMHVEPVGNEDLTTELVERGQKRGPGDGVSASDATWWAMLRLLQPFFWPTSGSRYEVGCNRARSLLTWVCVAISKVLNILAPLFLASATNAVLGRHTAAAVRDILLYAVLYFASKTFKEFQSLVYISVSQAAYIEMSDHAFVHLHGLSLDWHLQKQLGSVVRSIDRGITAAQQMMTYLVLYLMPTIAECIAVCVIFAFHFESRALAVFVFVALTIYAYVTVTITQWRKRFRVGKTQNDNKLHDQFSDTLINYESVKYFTQEEYERGRYRESVTKYRRHFKCL